MKFEIGKKYLINEKIFKVTNIIKTPYGKWINFDNEKGHGFDLPLRVAESLNATKYREKVKKTVVKYTIFKPTSETLSFLLDEICDLDTGLALYDSLKEAKNAVFEEYQKIAKITIDVEEIDCD